MYLDAQGNVIRGASLVGYKAIGVPGSVAGLVYAQKKYGKLSLAQVMAPAIKLARDGFALAYEDAQDLRDPKLTWASLPNRGAFFSATASFTSPARFSSSRSWRTPWSGSRRILTTSITAKWRENWRPRSQKGGGLITAKDLAGYEVKEREPVRGTYRGYDIISAPPPSSGGMALVEILNILEGYDLKKYGAGSAQAIAPDDRSLPPRVL